MSSPNLSPAITADFEQVVLQHLDAAYRLARWLVANDHDAEDVVQDACLRALRYFPTFSGGNSRGGFCGSSATPAMAGTTTGANSRPTRSTRTSTAVRR